MAEDDAWLLCTTFKQLLGYQLIRLQRRTILFQHSLSSQKIQHLEALFHYSNKNIPFVDNPSNALEMPLVQKYQTDHFMCKADRKSEVRQCLGFFQVIHKLMQAKNQLYTNPNNILFETSCQLCLCVVRPFLHFISRDTLVVSKASDTNTHTRRKKAPTKPTVQHS